MTPTISPWNSTRSKTISPLRAGQALKVRKNRYYNRMCYSQCLLDNKIVIK